MQSAFDSQVLSKSRCGGEHGFFQNYRPEIDGLRAIAVLGVVIFHAGLGLPGGFVGVDIFFVISGYLITGIILRDLSEGRFKMVNFWSRRIRRILPATTVVIIATLAASGFIMMPKDFEETARSALASNIASANFFFWKYLDYFGERGETRPLLHMWSLAVEEQFYLGYPFLLAFLWKRWRGHTLLLLVGVWLVSLAGSVVGLDVARSATFYLLPARAWELLTGALLAIVQLRAGACSYPRSGLWRRAASWTGIALIAAACFGYSAETPFPGPAALPPCLGAALLIWSQSAGVDNVGRLLSWAPLRWIGQMSFSIYLWHWPILALLRYGFMAELPAIAIMLALCATLLCSWASWRFIEIPFRRSNERSTPGRVILAGICALLILSVAAGVVTATGGLPRRVPDRILSIGVGDMRPDEQSPTVPFGFFSARDPVLPMVGADLGASALPDVVFWGDSHAEVISPLLHEIGLSKGMRVPVASMHGVAPLDGIWARGLQDDRTASAVGKVLTAIEALRPTRVVMVSRWSLHLGRATDGSGESPHEVCCRALRRTVDRLKSAGVREIVICGEVPRQSLTPPQVALRTWWFDQDPRGVGVSTQQHALEQVESARFLAFARTLDGVRVVDLADSCFDRGGVAYAQDSEGTLYTDDDHLDCRGARHYLQGVVRALLDQ